MEYVVGNDYEFYGKIDSINPSTYETYPVIISNENCEKVVLRATPDMSFSNNKVYYFKCTAINFKERVHLQINEFTFIDDIELSIEERNSVMVKFYEYAPVPINELQTYIESKINSIENEVIKKITTNIYEKYKSNFYLYPAGTKLHHSYISGLAFHTKSMLAISEGLINEYPLVSKDLVYAGILLHDVAKTLEFTCYEGAEYSKEGKLIGHISLAFREIEKEAVKLGLENTEEVLMLQHVILSHHYHGNFGSPKRPMMIEALIVHLVDNIDSKMRVVSEELSQVNVGEFTDMIQVCDKEKYYRHKLNIDKE